MLDAIEKLKNYFQNKLGISNSEFASADLNLQHTELSKLDFELKTQGKDISLSDVSKGENNYILYGDRQVVLYIRDQYEPKKTPGKYKYHIAWCDHLKKMEKAGSMKRYVVSTRDDGLFIVNKISSYNSNYVIAENIEEEMDVCINCLGKLRYKGFIFERLSKRERLERVKNFNLKEFFDNSKLSNEFKSNVEKHDILSNRIAPINIYSEKWRKISFEVRMRNHWRCSKCGESFAKNRSKLTVHHIDHNKSNNSLSNLEPLCEECHKKLHSH